MQLWRVIEKGVRAVAPGFFADWSTTHLQVLFLLIITGLLMAVLLIMGRRLYRAYRPEKPPKHLPNGQKVYITRVVDGDTFVAKLGRRRQHTIKVRVLGIDTPENKRNAKVTKDAKRQGSSVTAQIRVGQSAKKRAQKLLESHHVKLESNKPGKPIKKDLYGRYLAYVRLKDKKDYGLLMIEEGLAEDFGWKYPHPRKAAYLKAQKKAPDLFKRKSWWRRLFRR